MSKALHWQVMPLHSGGKRPWLLQGALSSVLLANSIRQLLPCYFPQSICSPQTQHLICVCLQQPLWRGCPGESLEFIIRIPEQLIIRPAISHTPMQVHGLPCREASRFLTLMSDDRPTFLTINPQLPMRSACILVLKCRCKVLFCSRINIWVQQWISPLFQDTHEKKFCCRGWHSVSETLLSSRTENVIFSGPAVRSEVLSESWRTPGVHFQKCSTPGTAPDRATASHNHMEAKTVITWHSCHLLMCHIFSSFLKCREKKEKTWKKTENTKKPCN